MLIIFPLIIYYSGSSKQCLLLFEFLKAFGVFLLAVYSVYTLRKVCVYNATEQLFLTQTYACALSYREIEKFLRPCKQTLKSRR
jgi:NADH:ubiquinone oxidoreductase subunit 4 (subunit M)